MLSCGPARDLLRRDDGARFEIYSDVWFPVAMSLAFIRCALVRLPCHGSVCRAGTVKPTAQFDVRSRFGPTGLASIALRHAPSCYFLPPRLRRISPESVLASRVLRHAVTPRAPSRSSSERDWLLSQSLPRFEWRPHALLRALEGATPTYRCNSLAPWCTCLNA